MDYKDVMHDVVFVGDTIFCRGQYAEVKDIIYWRPNNHPDSPIRNDMTAIEFITECGSRWKGIK